MYVHVYNSWESIWFSMESSNGSLVRGAHLLNNSVGGHADDPKRAAVTKLKLRHNNAGT